MAKDENFSETFKTWGSIAATILPLAQFALIWLPQNISGLYLGKDSFFITSIVTIIVCYSIISAYRSNPYFKFVPDKEAQQKYFKYVRESNILQTGGQSKEGPSIMMPPVEYDAKKFATLSVIMLVIAGMGFIWMGLKYGSRSVVPSVSIIQAFFYILFFSTSAYLFMHFSYQDFLKKMWKKNRQERVRKALNLAIENKSFEDIPQIIFIGSWDNPVFPRPNFAVQVKINGNKYNIFTSPDADEIYEVQKVIEPLLNKNTG